MKCNFCLTESEGVQKFTDPSVKDAPVICANCVMAIDAGTYVPPNVEESHEQTN